MVENGAQLESISRRLGHEDSVITRKVYLHITKKMKEKDNQQFAAINIF